MRSRRIATPSNRSCAGTASIRARRCSSSGSRAGGFELDRERYEALLAEQGESIALVLLPGVQYLTGERLDLAAYAAAAQRYGCCVGFDLAHAIGNVPLAVHDSGADFAAWCSYKYLNAGPGAVGGCFVHRRHGAAENLPRLAGWWGHDRERRFLMEPKFTPLSGAEGWQLSNPPILSLAPLAASLALFDEAGMKRLRRKSLALTRYLEWQLERELGGRARLLTPIGSRPPRLSLAVQFSAAAARPAVVRRASARRRRRRRLAPAERAALGARTALQPLPRRLRRRASAAPHARRMSASVGPAHRDHRRRTRGQLARDPARAPRPRARRHRARRSDFRRAHAGRPLDQPRARGARHRRVAPRRHRRRRREAPDPDARPHGARPRRATAVSCLTANARRRRSTPCRAPR